MGSGELAIETAGLRKVGVLLCLRAQAAFTTGFINEKNDLLAIRFQHELLLHLIAGSALVFPFRIISFDYCTLDKLISSGRSQMRSGRGCHRGRPDGAALQNLQYEGTF